MHERYISSCLIISLVEDYPDQSLLLIIVLSICFALSAVCDFEGDILQMGFSLYVFSYCEQFMLLSIAVVLLVLFENSYYVLAQNGVVPTCYFPDQTIALNNYACSLSSNNSACCAIGHICLDNGLCTPGDGEIFRGACTDKTWRSLDCPLYCLRK